MGRYGEALILCRRLLAVDTGGWNCYLMAGILEKLARPGEALLWYSRAFQLGVRPRRGAQLVLARCRWKTALALKQAGRIREALACFTLLAREYGRTPYGRRAPDQVAALTRLQHWEEKGK
jgi:tetratricopeptide (TPR) repeat protein